jgi:hypothetical protein
MEIYLATGYGFMTHLFYFVQGNCTISRIVAHYTKAVWECLYEEYMLVLGNYSTLLLLALDVLNCMDATDNTSTYRNFQVWDLHILQFTCAHGLLQ